MLQVIKSKKNITNGKYEFNFGKYEQRLKLYSIEDKSNWKYEYYISSRDVSFDRLEEIIKKSLKEI